MPEEEPKLFTTDNSEEEIISPDEHFGDGGELPADLWNALQPLDLAVRLYEKSKKSFLDEKDLKEILENVKDFNTYYKDQLEKKRAINNNVSVENSLLLQRASSGKEAVSLFDSKVKELISLAEGDELGQKIEKIKSILEEIKILIHGTNNGNKEK